MDRGKKLKIIITKFSTTHLSCLVKAKTQKQQQKNTHYLEANSVFFFPWFGSAAFLLDHWETLQIPLQHGFNTASTFDILSLSFYPFYSSSYYYLFLFFFWLLFVTLPLG